MTGLNVQTWNDPTVWRHNITDDIGHHTHLGAKTGTCSGKEGLGTGVVENLNGKQQNRAQKSINLHNCIRFDEIHKCSQDMHSTPFN